MRILFTLVAKDFANILRNRAALILTFVVPIFIIYIVGLVFGFARKTSGPTGIPLAVVNQSHDPGAAKLVDSLKAEKAFRVITDYTNPDKTTRPLTEADLRPLIDARTFSYALVIPADATGGSEIGIHLKLLEDPRNDIESQFVNGILQKTIFTSVPQLLGRSLEARARNYVGDSRLNAFNRTIAANVAKTFGGDPDEIFKGIQSGDFGFNQMPSLDSSSNGGNDFFSRLIRIDKEQIIGKQVKSPQATQTVGGYAVMFLLFAVSTSAAAFFDEQNAGLFQRLLAAPVRRSHLLWSRFLFSVIFGLIQLVTLFLAGHFLYGIDIFSHFGNLLLVAGSVAAACTGFGMLIAAVTNSPQAANSLATLLVISMSALGGAWFPVSFMPEFMQHVAKFTLVYWAIEGFSSVLWAGDPLVRILPIIGILLGITVAVMTIAVWRFNRSRIFD